uniref:Uncharacterized protein n=1 Tax=uncultured Desulfobacterium sp. TaxID=201089 RepID=E1YKQ5_9BACT|nr:unknown protein [uncultured Desulfobacterium sp.]
MAQIYKLAILQFRIEGVPTLNTIDGYNGFLSNVPEPNIDWIG